MSTRTDSFYHSSQHSSSSRFMTEKNVSVKRFRPSVQCQHVNKDDQQPCSADGFMECVHCDQICCLKHITEHQNELKEIRDKLVEEANDIYLSLTEMQPTDSREELKAGLDLWKKRMFQKIERCHSKLLEDVEKTFVTVTDEFEAKKQELSREFEGQVSTKLERLSNKADFYPHELDELKSSLKQLTFRIRETRTSVINIDYGNGIVPLIEDDQHQSFDDDQEFEIPKIVIQSKPDLERLINRSYLRQFQVECEEASNANAFLYDTSNKYMLIYNHNNETLQLFNHEERIGVGLWTKESSLVQCIKWSSYLNTFLILSTQTLHSLDCSQQPFHITPISQITPLHGIPMKYLSVSHDSMFLKHGNGVFIDYFSLKKMESIQRWSKTSFYNYDDITVDIHRIEFYGSSYLAMNVELNEETDAIDVFLLPSLQHIRRLENAYLILYLPLNNHWIIKEKADNGSMLFSLLDQQGTTSRLNLHQAENIVAFHFFGKQFFLVFRQNPTSIHIQLHHIDHF